MKETLFNKKIDNVIIIISIISVVLSFSRTNYFILLIIFFVPYLFYLNASSKIMISMLLFVIVNIFAGQVFEIKVTNLDEVTFGEKIKHSLSEVVVRQMDDRNDISDNWRGYEAYMGVKQYLNGNSVQLLFGQGLGANVKTPYWVFEGEYLNVIPIFHNGFITILLKTGIVGLILIFWFLITLMNSKQPLKGFRLDHHLLCKVSLGYFFLVNTFVTHGVFTKQAPFLSLLLLGAICSTLNNRRYVI